MTVHNVDVAIIGAGTAGMRAYREVTKVTDSVLLIEDGPYGTVCARVGCMPSKLLIAAAEAADQSRHSKAFGVTHEKTVIDGQAVMRRVRAERDRFVGFVVETVEEWPERHRVRARATFVSDHDLALSDGSKVIADRIVIASGSRPNVPKPFEVFGDRILTNDSIFELETLPSSVAVFGAGVIGLELSQALSRLQVRTTLFGRGNLVGPMTDPMVVDTAKSLFGSHFDFHPDGDVTRMNRTEDGIVIEHSVDGVNQTEHYDYALVATGRLANVDNLGLENTSLKRDERGVPDYNVHTGRCGDSHIFIAGDANNLLPLLHEASDEGMAAGYNAAHFPAMHAFRKSTSITVVFSEPQLMMVGQSHKQLIDAGIDFAVGEVDWSDQGRSRVMLMNEGLLRVYGEHNTGRFLGAEMIGPRAEHLAHLLAWAHQSNLTVSEMLERPFYHPVVEEGVRSALRDLNKNLLMGPNFPPRCLDCGPGA